MTSRLHLVFLILATHLSAAELYLPPVEARFEDPDHSAVEVRLDILQKRGLFDDFDLKQSVPIGADGVVLLPERTVKSRTVIAYRFAWREPNRGERMILFQFKAAKGKGKVRGKRRMDPDNKSASWQIDNERNGDCGNLFQFQETDAKLVLTLKKPDSLLACMDPGVPFTDFNLIGQRTINKGQLNYYNFDDDVRLGSDFATNMDQTGGEQNPTLDDPIVENYVTQMVNRIAKASDMPDLKFRIKVIDADVINAFALPGGFLYVYRGLIENTQSEAELAGVLAHEIAHVTSRHGTEGVTAATNKVALGMAVGQLASHELEDKNQLVVGLVQNAISAGTQFWILGGGRKREAEADYLGAQYARQAGYDPRGIAMFFSRMAEGKQGGTRLDELFSDHPSDENRINANNRQVDYFLPPTQAVQSSAEYHRIKKHLAQLPRPKVSGQTAGNALFSSFQQANQVILEKEIAALLEKQAGTEESQTP